MKGSFVAPTRVKSSESIVKTGLFKSVALKVMSALTEARDVESSVNAHEV